MINTHEKKYLIYSLIFALIWFTFLLPYLIVKYDGNSPISQFLLFNIGLIVFLQVFLKSVSLKKSVNIVGSIGVILLFIALDILAPPYAITNKGDLISSGPLLVKSSSDYFAATVGQSIGVHGVLLYYFTYILFPVVLLIVSAKLLPNLVKEL